MCIYSCSCGDIHAKKNSPSAMPHPPALTLKVENLNILTESNAFLRVEKDHHMVRIQELESAQDRLEGELDPLKETNKQLLGLKDALLAEKTALR